MAPVTGWGQPVTPIVTAAGAGTSEATGTGAVTTPIATAEAYGVAEGTGTGAVSTPIATASAIGAIEVTGSGTPSTPLAEANGIEGATYVVGEGAVTTPMARAFTGYSYNVTIQHGPKPLGPDLADVGEVIDMLYFCEFRDRLHFDLAIKTDYFRFSCPIPYDENQSVINNQAAAGQPLFRHSIQAVPKAGLWGSLFEVTLVKQIPRNGFFKAFGYDMHVVPRPGMGPEFITSSGDIANGWE